ncbi:MAG: hypothetical protein ACR2Q4_10060 [Geminicoccaceae bacterium]
MIRNAEIDGALLFYNSDVSIPLSFANVWFRGYNYEKDVFGEDVEAPVKDRAIAIVNSRFGDRIQISASKLCGDVRITESRFAESLKFLHVEQRGITCEPYDPDTPPKIRIDSSTFGQGLTTAASSFAMLDVYSSAIHSFSSSRTNFGRRLRVWESDIGSMQVDCSTLADTVDISYNYVSKDLFVAGIGSNITGGVPCRNWWKEKSPSKKTQLTISSNKIGGGLGLSDFLASRFGPEIDLTSNRVGNGSEIYLPAPDDIEQQWQGKVKLEGSSYEGKIEIAVDQVKVADSTEEQPFEIADTYCPPATGDSSSGATIDFRAARIRTLVWNLPLTCAYRWSGYGLTYDLWLAGENPKKSVNTAAQDSDQEVLKAWRTTLVRYQSASLDAMSRYLAEKGAYVESRAILLEAKRLNYAPDCPPHSSALSCIVDLPSGFIPTGPWSLAANAQDAGNTLDANDAAAVIPPDKAGPSRFQSTWRSWFGETMSSIWSQVWKILMLVLLWPGGYGAAPERTIILTGILAVIFFAVYWYYSRRLEHKLTAVPGYPKGMLTIKTRSLEEASAQSDRPDGLGDVARSEEFTHDALGDRDQPSSDDTQSSDKTTLPWPTKLEWGGLDANRRLSVIQDILRPAIEKQAEKSSKANQQSELRELRKRLEWFGNTETLGFSLFDRNRMPTRFTHWLYSVDTMLPFIDLHAYGNYYAESGCIRAFSVVQHVLGWWLITVFIASAAIL